MRLTKEDKNVLIYASLFVVTVIFFVLTLQVRQRGSSILESPRLLPYIVEAAMTLLSLIGLAQSLIRKGRPTPKKILGSLKACWADANLRNTLLAIAIVAVYVLVGIPYFGFYLSSFLLILGITIGYVKSLKFYWAIPIAAVLTGILYLIFAVAFQLRLM